MKLWLDSGPFCVGVARYSHAPSSAFGRESTADRAHGVEAVSTDKALERVVQELLLVMKIILNNESEGRRPGTK